MKHFRVVLMVAASIMIASMAFAAMGKDEAPAGSLTQKNILQRFGFIDENGDGINDLARDSDNDGIPNCIDPDWVRPQDGTGYMGRGGHKYQHAQMNNGQQNGGCNNFNYNYTHQWQNTWSGGNGNSSGNTGDPDLNHNRNRRTNGKR
jgi:hypothetical protein